MTNISNLMNKGFLVSFFTLHLLSSTHATNGPKDLTLARACGLTKYRQLCTETLERFSKVSNTPYVWARGGVVVTVWDIDTLNGTLVSVRDAHRLGGDAQAAIVGCVRNIDSALVRIQYSLQVLRTINSGHFKDEVDAVMRWLRSSSRDVNMCMNAISNAGSEELLNAMGSTVENSAQIINNALSLNTYLAKVGMPTQVDHKQ